MGKNPQNVYIGSNNTDHNLERSKWANPFEVGPNDYSIENSLRYFEAHVRSNPELYNNLLEIDGKQLGCTCSPAGCHAERKQQINLHQLPTLQPGPDSNITIIMDSNRRNINFKKLFPTSTVTINPCGTIDWAKNHVTRNGLNSPTHVILHLGTNDAETKSADEILESMKHLIHIIKEKYKCTVFVSTILPRNDQFNDTVNCANDLFKKACITNLIKHDRIGKEHLHDLKHLNRYALSSGQLSGCQLLAQDFYSALYGVYPNDSIIQSVKHFDFVQNQYKRNPLTKRSYADTVRNQFRRPLNFDPPTVVPAIRYRLPSYNEQYRDQRQLESYV